MLSARAAAWIFALAAVLSTGCEKPGVNARPASDVAGMGPLEPATNRPGRDLSDNGAQADSAQECASRCADDSRCQAMSFAQPSPPAAGICFLKGSVPEPASSPSIVSAVKQR